LRRRRQKFESVEYEPRSVRDLLTEMKDTSELVVDLAYASVIFDSEEMAEEVHELDEKMDRLLYLIRINAMLAARTVEEAEQLSGILQVAKASEDISSAARDIVRVLETDVRFRPFLPFLFSEADEKTRLITVLPGSSIVGKRLGELHIEAEVGVRVIAVRRGRRWFYDPEDSFVVHEGDKLVVIGVDEGVRLLRDCAEGNRRWGEWE